MLEVGHCTHEEENTSASGATPGPQRASLGQFPVHLTPLQVC